jgi:hypothetical protein
MQTKKKTESRIFCRYNLILEHRFSFRMLQSRWRSGICSGPPGGAHDAPLGLLVGFIVTNSQQKERERERERERETEEDGREKTIGMGRGGVKLMSPSSLMIGTPAGETASTL